MPRIIRAADLFAGAGGFSSGLVRACERRERRLDLTAVDHWPTAVETHARNHPNARHLCEAVESVDPRKAIPGGKLDLLLAAPECIYHSNARGGKPINDQSRASAWCILRWATALNIDTILIENVPEFAMWGPLGTNGRPLKTQKGKTFMAFIEAIRSLGYAVNYRVLNAANYGDPTTRQRLFIQAQKGRRSIVWPAPTHSADGKTDFFGALKPWVPAHTVIDWTTKGRSIFHRDRPLSPNTIARIAAGLKKFGGKGSEPFLVMLYGTNTARSLDRPLPTVTATGQHIGLCEPHLLTLTHGGRKRSVDEQLPTVTGSREIGLVEPFIIPYHGAQNGQQASSHSIDSPMPTVTTVNGFGLAEPFVLPPEGFFRGNAPRSVDDLLQTITANRGGGPRSIKDPFDTLIAKDRFGLVEADGVLLDILFRMLQPDELAASMSFPPDYWFAGNLDERVKQIGNAVPGKLGESLCYEALVA